MPHRCAILDDYQNVALKLADRGQLKGEVDVRVYNESLGDQASVIRTLKVNGSAAPKRAVMSVG